MKLFKNTKPLAVSAKLFGFTPYNRNMNKRQNKKTEGICRKVLSAPVEGLKVSRREIKPEDRFGGIFAPSNEWVNLQGISNLPCNHYLSWDIQLSREYFARRLQYMAHRLGDGLYYGRHYDGCDRFIPFTMSVCDDRIVLHWYDQKDSKEVWAMPTL